MSESNVFALVLAAGRASRFGATKQLARFGGMPLARRAARLGEAVCGPQTVLVTGHDWRAVFAASGPLAGFFVVNTEFATGLAGSITCGMRAVADSADAVLLLLADQPLITEQHLRVLITSWKKSPDAIVASAYAGIAGPPVVFPQRDFVALLALQGDNRARSILEANRDRLRPVEFAAAATDIDRPEDLPPDY
jgi:CTP:molybdopterin cytidylyltransferase MocA